MAGFWCTPDAFGQAGPASPQPEEAGRSTILEALRAIPWDTIQWVERRYKIEAIRFKTRDETGFDWLGSDEVMVQTNDAKGFTVSNEIGGIDSGDTHTFDPAKSCIVAVRPGVVVLGKSSVCDEAGEPAPLSFQVEFWEKDSGLPPYGFQVPPGPPGPGEHVGPCWADDEFDDDDFIGRAQIDYRRRTSRRCCFMSATKFSKPPNWTPAQAGSAPATPTTPLPARHTFARLLAKVCDEPSEVVPNCRDAP